MCFDFHTGDFLTFIYFIIVCFCCFNDAAKVIKFNKFIKVFLFLIKMQRIFYAIIVQIMNWFLRDKQGYLFPYHLVWCCWGSLMKKPIVLVCIQSGSWIFFCQDLNKKCFKNKSSYEGSQSDYRWVNEQALNTQKSKTVQIGLIYCEFLQSTSIHWYIHLNVHMHNK